MAGIRFLVVSWVGARLELEMDQKALVEQLKAGSEAAYEELVHSYARRLYTVSLRILRNSEEAEDAVQETFLKVVQKIDSFREESSLSTWLYRVACNEALMKLRRRGRDRSVPIEPYLPRFEEGRHAEAIADWSNLPDQELEARELADFFQTCIDELPEDYRLPYILKDVEKMSEQEVCRILGISRSAMKNRVHRARLVIRKRVEERFLS